MRFEDKTSKQTIIKYMTDGILLRESLIDPLLEQYKVIILDEIHERKVSTDILMSLLKKISQQWEEDFKLILTSATMDSKKFSKFFYDCSVYKIPGRSFPVEVFYAKKPETEYLITSVQSVIHIHLNQPAGDILLFLTG